MPVIKLKMKKEKIKFKESYENIISIENLLEAWKEFVKGKRNKKDVQIFQMRLMDNIFSLHRELLNHTYKHGGYQAFKINDPKPRDIHKAIVRDRLLHHAIYRKLYPFFDRIFITDSYSCRNNKGTHKAINRFRQFTYIVSKNNTQTCWILKCDIRKFFANIDHEILLEILREYVLDKNIIWLLENVIESFTSPRPLLNERGSGNVGLPLGNLTSQLFVNIYMNKFDQFVKHKLKVKCYIRYADDFVIFSEDKSWLEKQINPIKQVLYNELKLEMHPDKIFVKTINSGVDFLGMVNFFDHRILRTKTKKRMFKKLAKREEDLKDNLISEESFNQSWRSYLGVLGHCKGWKIARKLTPD
ncbi:MAG: reverse transcriptase/maturase family protein [Candidatus Moranbacteria bacterium]|nr:reverse transcriptase/maturase family protein [Candidatus Moranbacteria bacterium]